MHYFSRFLNSMLEVHLIQKSYIINFFPSINLTILGSRLLKIISVVQTNVFYDMTEKDLLEYVFVYDFVSPNVSLYSPQVCYIFV